MAGATHVGPQRFLKGAGGHFCVAGEGMCRNISLPLPILQGGPPMPISEQKLAKIKRSEGEAKKRAKREAEKRLKPPPA